MQVYHLPSHDSGFRRTFTTVDTILATLVAEEVGHTASAEQVIEAWPVLEEDIVNIINGAATMCQSLYRGHAVRKRVADGKRQAEEERRERAAVMIQRRHRGNQGRALARIHREATSTITRHIHGWVVRQRLYTQRKIAAKNAAAVKLQALVRGVLERKRVAKMRAKDSVCICGRMPRGAMIMCSDCFNFFHHECVMLPPSTRRVYGWRCPDCDFKTGDLLKATSNCKVKRKLPVPRSAMLVRIHADNDQDMQRLLAAEPQLVVSHAPRQLWPRDASAAPRQLQPLGVDSLTDEQAIERLQCLSSVRARLLRHQRRYDRIMGRMLTRLQGMPQDVELERPMTPLDVTRPRFAEVKPTWCTGSRKWVKKMEYEKSERKQLKEKQVQAARREKKQRAKEAMQTKGDQAEGNKLPQVAPPTASPQKGGASKETKNSKGKKSKGGRK